MDSIPATFEHGVFRPTEPVQLPEGCQVELSVVPRQTPPTESVSETTPVHKWIKGTSRRIADTVPAEEWERLPADLADRLDRCVFTEQI